MKNIRGTKTEKNLMDAFSGESKARNKYSFYASQIKKDGFVEYSKIIDGIAEQEKMHAKIWFKFLNDGKIPETEKNLMDCISGEIYESEDMYKNFEKEAKEEGFDIIARMFRMVGEIEKNHANIFKGMLSNIQSGNTFKSDEEVSWLCIKCGHVHKGKCPPEMCPVCAHAKDYFSKL